MSVGIKIPVGADFYPILIQRRGEREVHETCSGLVGGGRWVKKVGLGSL